MLGGIMQELMLDYNFAMKVNGALTHEKLEDQIQKARKGLACLANMVKTRSVGFPELPLQKSDDIRAISKECLHKFNDLVVIGIGGSALGFEAIVNALLPSGYNSLSYADRRGYPRYWLLDNTDPSVVNSVLKFCNSEDTYVVVISKSGTTLETAINFSMVFQWLTEGVKNIKKHICVVTDPQKGPLRDIVKEKELTSLALPANIGGRYSVLSAVGLLPAALLGLDTDRLLQGAQKIVESDLNLVLYLSSIYMHFLDNKRSINVLMPYSSRLVKFAEWFCQLWGESLGKRYTTDGKEVYFGSTPMRTTGAIDQHSQLQLFREGPDDKLITFLALSQHDMDRAVTCDIHESFNYLLGHKIGELLNTELNATESALYTLSRPSIRINLSSLDELTLGALFMLFQYVVATIGLANDIDPFDQPAVEEGKDFAYGLMGRAGYEHKKAEFEKLYVKREEFII
jgi:glucose-6-phosphate isomerase